ncbi:MAG TPA: RNase H family protein, partial [Chloroflexia bacterium]|nr:RNase H family protein [Chloroflexia bacterium]
PEWAAIEQAIQKSQTWDAALWQTLARCPVITAYSDGGAPIRDPGGPAGVGVIVVGKDLLTAPAWPASGRERVRLELSAHIPARFVLPATSQARAELAGVLAALAVLWHLGARGWRATTATVWSDSRWVVECANRRWQRRTPPDLWRLYGAVEAALRPVLAHGVTVAWVQGHAGYGYNAVADDLATRAALEFDAARYKRYRAAQAATGSEMPGPPALARFGLGAATAPPPALAPPTLPHPAPPRVWIQDAHYTLVVYAPGDQADAWYQLWTRDGRSLQARVPATRQTGPAEERTLTVAVRALLWRIRAAGRRPQDYTLDVYRVEAPADLAPTRALLEQFKAVAQQRVPAPEIAAVFATVAGREPLPSASRPAPKVPAKIG